MRVQIVQFVTETKGNITLMTLLFGIGIGFKLEY